MQVNYIIVGSEDVTVQTDIIPRVGESVFLDVGLPMYVKGVDYFHDARKKGRKTIQIMTHVDVHLGSLDKVTV